jgi:hypothetical protein
MTQMEQGRNMNPHRLATLLTSSTTAARMLRYGLFGAAFICGVFLLKAIPPRIGSPEIFRRDFLQDYLMGRALVTGVTPVSDNCRIGKPFLGGFARSKP